MSLIYRALVVLMLISLLACGKTVSRETVGPVSVAVALDKEPAEVGPMVAHVQISSPDGTRPLGDAMISAVGGEPGAPMLNQVVVPVATPGASEIRFSLPEGGAFVLTVTVRSERGPLGQLTYEVRAGAKGVKLISKG